MPLLKRGKPHFKPTPGPRVAGWPTQVGPRVQLARKQVHWGAIPRPEFHGLIAALAGLERSSPAGAIRNHYRRRRLAAVDFYARHFGPTPDFLRARKLTPGIAFYRTAEFRAWAARAHDPPAPEPRP